MKNLYKILASTIIFIFMLSFSFVAFAQNGYCNPNAPHSDPNKFLPLMQCGSAGQPCCDFTEAANLVNRIINWFISLSAVVAAVTFAIAGAKMLMNPENDSERTAAKDMFKKTVYGLIIVLVAWLVIKTVVGFFVDPSIGALRFLDVAK